MGGARNGGITANDVAWVELRAGESLGDLAGQVEVAVWQLRKYNDLDKADRDTRFTEDRNLYIQPKRRRGERHWHVASGGVTLRDVSQFEAVKLKVLVQRTGLDPDQPLKEGQRIPLRFAPGEDGRLPWYAWGGGER